MNLTPEGAPPNGPDSDPKHAGSEGAPEETAPGDDEVDEWERESFPASDPPANW